MRYFKISVMLLIAYILQISVFSKVHLFGVCANLVLTILICFSLKEENWLKIGILSAVVGLFCGASEGAAMGFSSLLLMALSMLCSILASRFFKGKFVVSVLFVFFSSLLYECVYYVFGFALWHSTDALYCIVCVVVPSALVNTVFGAVLYKPIDNICKL